MQRKGNKPKIYSNISSKLHSIPKLKKNVKPNVVYSIPTCMLVLLSGLFFSASCSAICNDTNGYCSGTISDRGTISSVTPPTVSPTASISLSKASLASDTVSPGESTAVSTDVTVKLSDVESYNLTLSVDSTNIKNGDTTLTAGNAISDNTWGYKWDTATSYTAPTTSGTQLTVPTLAGGAANFTKTLTFGVKFGKDAEAGHYKASGTISLIATPKTTATITLAHLTQMQQITPEICTNTPYLDGKNYSETYELEDVRDGNKYTVAKLGDGRCWMTSNLMLTAKNADGEYYYTGGRILNPTTSDIASNWTLPAQQDILGLTFNDNTQANVFGGSGLGLAYYTWCAATAGTCSSATSQGAHATSSICPKGWRLPGGYDDETYGNEFYILFKNMRLTISDVLSSNSATAWGANDLAKVQGPPYDFNYTGSVYNGSYYTPTSSQNGGWWSGTAYNDIIYAYPLHIDTGGLFPGTGGSTRYTGFAVRCIANNLNPDYSYPIP